MAMALKSNSWWSRAASSPALQTLYARIRGIPVLGEYSHKLMQRVVPTGSRFATRVRKGAGAGLCLSLDPRYEAQYAAGSHETALLACLSAHLKPGDVFYDVGAHIGYISLVAGRLVGPGGKVFAFEADPGNALRITAHVAMNSMPQVELVGAAVWSECKRLSFHQAAATSSRNTGAVANREQGKGAEGMIVVEAVTLDYFAADHPSPAVVKIDVEGAEEDVLKGAHEVFRRSHPTLICEVHNERAATGVAAWLANMGYQSEWLPDRSEFPRHLVARPSGTT
jgi:FkbM family methyltransferase